MATRTGDQTAAAAAWRHNPDGTLRSLSRRRDDKLPFDPAAMPDGLPVILDTTVYIARLADRLPANIVAFVAGRTILHCGVVLAALAITAGLLDPADVRTVSQRESIRSLLASIDLRDCRSAGPAAWAEAGMLSGILARTQLGLARPKKICPPWRFAARRDAGGGF